MDHPSLSYASRGAVSLAPMRALALARIALVAGVTALALSAQSPNIVFILADDVGDQAIGCYGGTSYSTPRVDALAADGMRFRHCYSMPVCHPTRLTLLTGQYPFRTGPTPWGAFPRNLEESTVAQRLRELGYATAVAGKWQLTLLRDEPDHPRRLGFDRWSLFGWHEGPRYYRPMIYEDGELRSDVNHRYGPDVYVDLLVDFMETHRDQPFFAFYSMALAHDVTDDIGTPPPLGPQGHYDSYRRMVENMDERVGRLVDAADRLGIRDRTLFIFTADNGTPKSYYFTAQGNEMLKQPIEFNWNGVLTSGGKGELTDAGTRVPLIANWQGTLAPGQVVDDLVDFSDWLPTFVELAGGTAPTGLDGVSLADRLRGGDASQRKWAFASRRGSRWVRSQRWKLYDDGRLFDLGSGRAETGVVALSDPSPAARKARAQLESALRGLAPPD